MAKNRSFVDEVDHRIDAMEAKLVEYKIARKVLAEIRGSADPEIEIEHQPMVNGNGKMPLVTVSRERKPLPPPPAKRKLVKTPAKPDFERVRREREAVRQVMTSASTNLPIHSSDLAALVRERLGGLTSYQAQGVYWAFKRLRQDGEITFNEVDQTYNLPG